MFPNAKAMLAWTPTQKDKILDKTVKQKKLLQFAKKYINEHNLTKEDNILNKFNNVNRGVEEPRGKSISISF